jgi:hypothetical protein
VSMRVTWALAVATPIDRESAISLLNMPRPTQNPSAASRAGLPRGTLPVPMPSRCFFSARDVWIFSTGPGSGDNPGVLAAHHNGHRWKQIGLPGILNQVSAVSTREI